MYIIFTKNEELLAQMKSVGYLIVDAAKSFNGFVPRKVCLHGVSAAKLKQLRLMIQNQGFADGFGKCSWGVFIELDARGDLWILRPINDAIIKPSDRANNWNGSIAQAIHLIQTARLEPGWHQEEIATGLNSV